MSPVRSSRQPVSQVGAGAVGTDDDSRSCSTPPGGPTPPLPLRRHSRSCHPLLQVQQVIVPWVSELSDHNGPLSQVRPTCAPFPGPRQLNSWQFSMSGQTRAKQRSGGVNLAQVGAVSCCYQDSEHSGSPTWRSDLVSPPGYVRSRAWLPDDLPRPVRTWHSAIWLTDRLLNVMRILHTCLETLAPGQRPSWC